MWDSLAEALQVASTSLETESGWSLRRTLVFLACAAAVAALLIVILFTDIL